MLWNVSAVGGGACGGWSGASGIDAAASMEVAAHEAHSAFDFCPSVLAYVENHYSGNKYASRMTVRPGVYRLARLGLRRARRGGRGDAPAALLARGDTVISTKNDSHDCKITV